MPTYRNGKLDQDEIDVYSGSIEVADGEEFEIPAIKSMVVSELDLPGEAEIIVLGELVMI